MNSGSDFTFTGMTMANGGTGTLNIGAGADAGGTIHGTYISGSSSNATINFDHTNAVWCLILPFRAE
ncbi:MAG: hypothetical protein WDN72_02415 [Alphaproteobacteria bacterium]